jgi:hypothetical protein
MRDFATQNLATGSPDVESKPLSSIQFGGEQLLP